MTAAPDHEVAIIGAGLSGLGVAAALRHAGIDDVVIFERADDVGGTWRDNTYPGIGVDIPALAYQFSYDLKPDWSRLFPSGAEVKAYVDDYVAKQGLEPCIRLRSEVTARTWDEDQQMWRLAVNGGDEVTARFVVSAIGAFVDPKPVAIDGLEDFAGKLIHSARWDHSYELTGERVAIIGTGASAVQIIPSIAPRVASLDVYQRTPIWVFPKFDPEIPEVVKRLFARVPASEQLARHVASAITELVLIFMTLNYTRLPFIARSLESRGRWFIAGQVRDPELRRKLTPDYGLGCKRPSVSNDYLRAFNRENVTLITDPIERLTATGVRAGGTERDVDAIVLATGFRLASDPENYRRTPVRGRDGFDLATQYERHRLRAYEGVSMPGLPNHFIIFGPYGWTGASWHVLVQTASRHITRVIAECRRRGATEVEVTEEATERFFEFVQRRLAGSVWANGNCATANSYYFDHHGDVPYLRPTSGLQAQWASRSFSLDDYRYRVSRADASPPRSLAGARARRPAV